MGSYSALSSNRIQPEVVVSDLAFIYRQLHATECIDATYVIGACAAYKIDALRGAQPPHGAVLILRMELLFAVDTTRLLVE